MHVLINKSLHTSPMSLLKFFNELLGQRISGNTSQDVSVITQGPSDLPRLLTCQQ